MVKKVKTNKALEEALFDLQGQKAALDENMAERNRQIVRLNAEQAIAKSEAHNFNVAIAETHNRLFVRTALEPKVVAARNKLIEKMVRSVLDTITVAKQRALMAEITTDQAALQELCTHPFVFSYDGYGGSHSMDGDDAYRGHRVCTVCNKHEMSEGTREDLYTVLTGDRCLVRRDLRDKEKLARGFEKEWFTLEFLKKLFEASVGGINIVWPKTSSTEPVLKS